MILMLYNDRDVMTNSHAVNHSTQELVKQTTADLKSLSASLSSASPSIHHPSSSDDAALRLRKLEQQKLSKDFQVVLARFQQVQRQSAEKSRDYVAKARAHTVHQDQDQDDGYVLECVMYQRACCITFTFSRAVHISFLTLLPMRAPS